jgi:integration host factor subunit beta
MTKADLVEEVVRVSNVSKKHAEIIVNTVFSSIIEALQRDDKIELRGFGSFRVRRRRSRQGRNPKTGDRVEVPEKRIPYFKPGKELKDLINGLVLEASTELPSGGPSSVTPRFSGSGGGSGGES